MCVRLSYVHRAFILRSSTKFDLRGSIKAGVGDKQQSLIAHHSSTEAQLLGMAILPQRIKILKRMPRDEEETHDGILALFNHFQN